MVLCQKTQPVDLWLLHVARPGEHHGEQDLGEADGVARPQVPLPLLLLCPQVLQCQGQVRGRGQVGRGSVVMGLVETAMVTIGDFVIGVIVVADVARLGQLVCLV